jgi:hypothetical protein
LRFRELFQAPLILWRTGMGIGMAADNVPILNNLTSIGGV